jgi:hypothetical protein
MDNIDMTSILKTLESFEEKKTETEIKEKQPTEEISENKVEKKEMTLTQLLEDEIKNSKLSEYVFIKGDELVTYNQAIKKLTINGRVSKDKENELNQLQNKLSEIISERIGPNFNMEEFWRVTTGIRIGDKFDGLDCFDINGDQVKIETNTNKCLIIDIWAQKPCVDLQQYFEIKKLTMDEILANKNGLDLQKLEFIGISGEENFPKWKSLVNASEIEIVIKQYQCKKIHEYGIENLPALLVIDNEGIVRFFENYSLIDFEESLKNLSLGKNEIVFRQDNTDQNSWWNDMDNQTKIDIVRDINISLKEIGCNNSAFVVKTNYTHKEGKVTSVTIPTFMGNIFETEYEILQNYAVELQNSWNFNGFEFNCKVIIFGNVMD